MLVRLWCAVTHGRRTVRTRSYHIAASRTTVEVTECSITCDHCGRVISEWIDR